jgi:adenylate cyclase class 2
MPTEIEIKFVLHGKARIERALPALGFHKATPRTHEMNTLYDLPGGVLRKRGDLLRLRQYGKCWTLTHKSKGSTGRHKSRVELETEVDDGPAMAAILVALGYSPLFRYEKFRTEWTDGTGHIVLDQTPIGHYGEIEGPARWIDRTANALGIPTKDYITYSYSELFNIWKRKNRSRAQEMTFAACARNGSHG